MQNRSMNAMLISLGFVFHAGCVSPSSDGGAASTAAPDGDGSDDANIVLRIEIEPGHAVSFYAPPSGGLLVVERMAPSQRFALRDREVSDALAAFARLRPGQDVPPALQAAYDRARSVASDSSLPEPGTIGGGQPDAAQVDSAAPGVVVQSLTSSSSAFNFVANDGGCDWGPQFSTCRVNWANGYFAQWNGTTSGLCIVDHYAGNGVIIQVTAGATITSSFQAAGTIAQYSLGTPGPAQARRIDVTNASGDSFHVGCRWGV